MKSFKFWSSVIFLSLAFATLISAQWLETTVPVPQSPEVLRWNSANNRVYCAVGYPDAFGAIAVIDGATNALLDTVMLPYQMPGGLCIDPGHNRVFCAGSSFYPLDDSLVTVIDGNTNTITAEIQTGGGPMAICYNPLQDKLYCASQLANQVYIIDCVTNTIRATRTVPTNPVDLCYAPEVNRIYCADQGLRSSPNFMVTVISGTSDSIIRTIYVGYYPRALCYNRIDRKIYCANDFDGSVSVIDAEGDTVVATVSMGGSPMALCWNPVTDRAYCCDGENGSVISIDGVTNNIVHQVSVVGPVWALSVDSAANKIYCSNYIDDKVTILDGNADTILKTISTGSGPRAMCHNPVNGRTYIANREGNSVAVIRDSASGGVEEQRQTSVERRELDVWPNPCKGVLNVTRRSSEQSKLELYDVKGQIVAILKHGANNISRLNSGIYFLKLGTEVEKFLVVK